MLRMIDLTAGETMQVDVVAYHVGDRLVIAVNVGDMTVARVSVPSKASAAEVIGQVAADVALRWPACAKR